MKTRRIELLLDEIVYEETKDLPRCDVCGEVFSKASLTRWGKRTKFTEPIDLCPECLKTINP